MQEVNSQEPCNSWHGHIVEGVQMGLKKIDNVSFNYVNREGTYAAHGLAKEAIKFVIDTTWRNEIPPCIYDIVKREEHVLSF